MAITHTVFSTAQVTEILNNNYGLKGKATILPGELDQNFKIVSDNGGTFILKISRPNTDSDELEFQNALLQYLEKTRPNIPAPRVKNTLNNRDLLQLKDEQGNSRYIRLITWIDGRLWNHVNPKTENLTLSLGRKAGDITMALAGFDHPFAHRELAWDTAQSLWIKEKLSLFNGEELAIVSGLVSRFDEVQTTYQELPKQVVHNDANENNILVSTDVRKPEVAAIIDFGDAIYTQRINDLGIACAYASMGHLEPLRAILPLINGYHEQCILTEAELEHLYITIQMRLATTVTKAAMNRLSEPENTYHFVSEQPAWEALKKWQKIDEEFALVRFREICGLTPHPSRRAFDEWISQQDFNLEQLFPTINRTEVHPLDLSVFSTWIGHEIDFNNLDWFQYKIDQLQKEVPDKIIAGGYLEPRPLYTDDSFDTKGDYGNQSRSVHLGVDFWLPAGTPVHAILEGEVVTATYQKQHKNYGGLIILKHQEGELTFYTLYGHLSRVITEAVRVGDLVKSGGCIGYLGAPDDNGAWAPHLHFQVHLSLLNYVDDFPGVAFQHEIESWQSICPDPMQLFGIDTLLRPRSAQVSRNRACEIHDQRESEAVKRKKQPSKEHIKNYRSEHLGRGMSLQYKEPLHIVRGNGAYLLDENGRKYLDTVNNVAHVGHEHRAVVEAGRDQMAVLNTNSRYLHQNIVDFSEALLETLPSELSVLHFVNSGSEANELAIRMARAVTGSRQVIASEIGYHGNTNMTVDISSYKFDGKGGTGAPDFTHIFPLPDAFRGKHRGANAGAKYLAEVENCIKNIHNKNESVGAFIIESIISCGGQIELPEGFLKGAFDAVRKAGGICISDEVQTGVGRVGKNFWGFELHDVVPDIVTIGKPIGNGHPLAVVACTREVADAFANGMEFFNTFGGNPVSCAIGKTVLDTVRNENLQQHAFDVGAFLKTELQNLAKDFPIIADVRGQGLFLGFELLDTTMRPLPDHADYLVNRMKEHSILMSTDGADHNVIKIKPPMVFSKENAETLLYYLRKVFQEDFMRV
ncbi:aminotransferase class III-fold pyridoxal phosphate-dependent enzyme [Dokdonia sinensis]|uniref:Aminotransferase class III-fold pyridoxal phosphate-dependent enzyme n=1 Tax=Dokdonia sinensis TaxID=2479847 RepID=A0A3M0G2K8_9FLAO|nr:aminotransferase class III-fold pyridoxal phosphate-dependent enzyme [Dokdonia sinensis]RMB59174.1 aminotransferase class III-fold pyridoxal phosphate-dependent enzyme [Dokdonia sinensis]